MVESVTRRSTDRQDQKFPMATPVKVYGPPMSTAVSRVLACLLEKDVQFQLIPVNMFKGEHKSPDFLKIQPFGQVPAFQDESTSLFESRSICRYLCEKYAEKGNTGLYGTNPLAKASIDQWLEAEGQSFNPPSSVLVFQLAFAPRMKIKQDQAVINENEQKLAKVLEVYEKRLGERESSSLSRKTWGGGGVRFRAVIRGRRWLKCRSRRLEPWFCWLFLHESMMESGAKEEQSVVGYNNNNVKKAKLHSTLAALLDDPILADVPKKPTLSDVDTLISLELGSAMRISILKLDGTSFDIAVMNSATVKDLKLAIKKKVIEFEQSKMGHRHISWRHVWANFCLAHHNEKLLDEGAALQDFGVRNNSQVQFVPYVVSKGSGSHSKRRKHRFFHGLNKRS
ncbi:Ubiquitin-like superfamily protein isoform 1 [Theobroma cacao]|uniref:glutathione transferase n=2 Tax=Theobroma cacao TaxID=3641 RepID=A0A061FL17_THECC|nr:Ubiquitin-like superfamily protein isoform 1 [Theobroma cacao]